VETGAYVRDNKAETGLGRAVSGDEQRYRRVLAGRGGADVDVKDLVVAEDRRKGVQPAGYG
jgi:hypothetical protein